VLTAAAQLTISPDGRYAFALVYGTSPAFYAQAHVIVVDIHKGHQVISTAESLR